MNGKKLVGLAVAHIPRGCRPSREIRLSRSDQVARRATRGALRSKVARGRAVARGVRNCRGGGRRMRRTSQEWYNMQYIDMSGKLPMGIAANPPRVRYSAAYPTGAERIVFSRVEHVERVEVLDRVYRI